MLVLVLREVTANSVKNLLMEDIYWIGKKITTIKKIKYYFYFMIYLFVSGTFLILNSFKRILHLYYIIFIISF